MIFGSWIVLFFYIGPIGGPKVVPRWHRRWSRRWSHRSIVVLCIACSARVLSIGRWSRRWSRRWSQKTLIPSPTLRKGGPIALLKGFAAAFEFSRLEDGDDRAFLRRLNGDEPEPLKQRENPPDHVSILHARALREVALRGGQLPALEHDALLRERARAFPLVRSRHEHRVEAHRNDVPIELHLVLVAPKIGPLRERRPSRLAHDHLSSWKQTIDLRPIHPEIDQRAPDGFPIGL